MPGEVMVPLDGTSKDARAIALAMALADVADAPLRLVRAVHGAPGEVAELRRALGADAEALAAESGRAATATVLEDPDAAAALVRHAAERAPAMVVMATRAPAATERALRGSVADRVMRESPRPVVLVPPGTDDVRGRDVRIARVLVPLDGSALSVRALDFPAALPGAAALEYVLLEVVAERGEVGAAEARLAAAARRLRARGATVVETAVVEAAEPAAAIVAAVRDALVDAIAMSTRGASGARRLVLGSVATAVVRHAEVPVLLLTPACLAATDVTPPA